jgi:hypothetical protein
MSRVNFRRRPLFLWRVRVSCRVMWAGDPVGVSLARWWGDWMAVRRVCLVIRSGVRRMWDIISRMWRIACHGGVGGGGSLRGGEGRSMRVVRSARIVCTGCVLGDRMWVVVIFSFMRSIVFMVSCVVCCTMSVSSSFCVVIR